MCTISGSPDWGGVRGNNTITPHVPQYACQGRRLQSTTAPSDRLYMESYVRDWDKIACSLLIFVCYLRVVREAVHYREGEAAKSNWIS